jgi:hypothetical protein
LKQGDAITLLFIIFAIQCALGRVQVIQDGSKLNDTHQLLIYADNINIFGGSLHTTKKNAEALVAASE